MPYVATDALSRLPKLAHAVEINRPVSTPEYYHASVGASPHTLESPRNVIFVLGGLMDGTLTQDDWQRAIDQAAAVNPGLRLRWEGRLGFSRWRSNGPSPRLRMLDHVDWDMNSQEGGEFITAEPLSLTTGPTVELIVARQAGGRGLVILRTLHTIVDGMGGFHAMYEIFRALRGEPLLGSNAAFSDVDLMRAAQHEAPADEPKAAKASPAYWLTGEPSGDVLGDDWTRIKLGPVRKQLLARLAVALTEIAHQYSEHEVVIAIPVDLRRHAPGLKSTINFSSMVHVRMEKGDGVEVFQQRLQALLERGKEVAYHPVLNLIRWLPLSWLDRLLGRSLKNYQTRKPLETFLISNIGRLDTAGMSAYGFQMDEFSAFPQPGNAFVILYSVEGEVNVILNLPRVLASQGRGEASLNYLKTQLMTEQG